MASVTSFAASVEEAVTRGIKAATLAPPSVVTDSQQDTDSHNPLRWVRTDMVEPVKVKQFISSHGRSVANKMQCAMCRHALSIVDDRGFEFRLRSDALRGDLHPMEDFGIWNWCIVQYDRCLRPAPH